MTAVGLNPFEPQRALGIAVRRCREEQRLTERTLAVNAEISVAQLCKIERGQTNPTWRSVAMIAEALGIAVAELARRCEEVDGARPEGRR